MPSVLPWTLEGARRQTLALLRSIAPDDAYAQSHPGEHHPGWVAGHLLLGDLYLLHLLGAAALPDDFAELVARYGPEGDPGETAAGPGEFEAVVERLAEVGRRRVEAVAGASEDDLDGPLPDAFMATAQPTIRHHLQAIAFHEGYHAGELLAWRRRRGLETVAWTFAPRSVATD